MKIKLVLLTFSQLLLVTSFIVSDGFFLNLSEDVNMAPKGGRPPTETEMQQLFLPFRGFCARKGVSN